MMKKGQLMIVGPTRMQYNRVVALMEYMSKVDRRSLQEGRIGGICVQEEMEHEKGS